MSEEPAVEHSNTCSKSIARAINNSTNTTPVLAIENISLVRLPGRLSNQMSSSPSNNRGAMKENNLTSLISYARNIGPNRTKTTVYRPVIHVNNKKIPCPGKFGLLCDVFSREIRADTFVQTELCCSMCFGASMETIYLYSLAPGGLSVDQSSKENLVLGKADTFLEAWAIECVDGSISLTDFWRKYKARTNAASSDLDMDVDALLKEEAAKVCSGCDRQVVNQHG